MVAAVLPALATCGVALVLASLVLARRERSPIHWVYLAMLVAVALWTGGVAWRHTHPDDAGVRQGLNLVYLGVHVTPPLWFWLAALYTRSPLAELRWVRVVSVVLPALGCLAWWTNDHHGLYASEVSHAAMLAGPRFWGGPLFWMSLTWTLAFAAMGLVLVAAHAWKARGRERRRAALLVAAALAPLALVPIYTFRLLPVPYDLTPTGLLVTMVIFYGLLTRQGMFEALPLARRDVIEHLRDGVLVADSEGEVLDANPASAGILGVAPGSAVGASLDALLAGAAVEEHADDVAREVARARASGSAGSVRFDTRPGLRVELSVAPVRGDRGRPAGLYAVLRDCTDQHRYEQIVRQSQKLESVGVLAAGVAHEVNNPLAFIQANLGSLQQMADTVERNLPALPEKDARELAELREVVDESLEGIARISRIVDRLRRFSRTPENDAGPVDANAVVEEAVRFARLHRRGGWRVETRLEPGLPPVRGSRDSLTQVLLNLLVNAGQAVAGRDDGRIEVRSWREGEVVQVAVRDNGPGVAESIRHHIFDPFFTTKSPDEGTGLGLAIAFDIAREHGGRLSLCEPGSARCDGGACGSAGACFVLTLPVATEAEAA